jgi:hypothetical protein
MARKSGAPPCANPAKTARSTGVASLVSDPDRPVRRSGRLAASRLCGGVSMLRYWLVTDAVAVPPEILSPDGATADEPMTRERQAEPAVRGTVPA